MNPDVAIAKALPADVGDILSLEKDCFADDAFSRRQISYLVSHAKGVFYLAKGKGTLEGYISLLTSKRTGAGRIYSVAVSPRFRGQGIAALLIERALDFAKAMELKSVFLEVRTDNSAAISLYESKGFVKRSVKQGYYEDGADAYSMVLRLL